ncbi:MAG: MFS transporter [Planctomycetota bacterium]|nr:MAG: MFS transporter [Planctomycetota bacterium]
MKPVLERVPQCSRPALFFESLYNLGAGSLIAVYWLSSVALKTIPQLAGQDIHLAVLSSVFGGSSLLSPLVPWTARFTSMRNLVVMPNLLVAACLAATAFPFVTGWSPAGWWFTACVGIAFIARVFPRVAEMNMYRVLYPPTARGVAVGWLKAVAGVAGLSTVIGGYLWFEFFPHLYWGLYVGCAALLGFSAWAYHQIPLSRRARFGRPSEHSPFRALLAGIRTFCNDKRFLAFQTGFAIGGAANHMAMGYVSEIMKETLRADDTVVRQVGALLPAIFLTACAPLAGRYLDRVNPMTGRAVFNFFQAASYGCYALGTWTRSVWPMVLGACLFGVANSGGVITWLTGSLYFARDDRIALYNAVHVALTGLRGMLAPLLGLYLYRAADDGGVLLLVVATLLSLAGSLWMAIQGRLDPGSRETDGAP